MNIPSLLLTCLLFFQTEPAGNLFTAQVIDDSLPGAYQVAVVDINADGRPDIAALGEGSGVVWYENPSWMRHPLAGPEITRPIDFAFADLNGDGRVETAVAYEFGMTETSSGGAIAWLERGEDVTQPWISHRIHAEPTAHRLRWMKRGETGRPDLIVAPIMGRDSKPPRFEQTGARLLQFHPPEDLGASWPMEVIDDSLHIVHGLFVPNDGTIYTASAEGVTRFCAKGEEWEKELVCTGSPEAGGKSGSSEIVLVALKNGGRFLATIDPWHGNEVVIYPRSEQKKPAERILIDDTFKEGHALACADFDGDGNDEIIAGYRGEGHTIYQYVSNPNVSSTWTRFIVDTEVAAQGFAVADVNGDGHFDLVAAGGSTHNVKLYINRGKDSPQ